MTLDQYNSLIRWAAQTIDVKHFTYLGRLRAIDGLPETAVLSDVDAGPTEGVNTLIWLVAYRKQKELGVNDLDFPSLDFFGGEFEEPEEIPESLDIRQEIDALKAQIAERDAEIESLRTIAGAPLPPPDAKMRDYGDVGGEPPAEVIAEAFPDEDYAGLKARLLVELSHLRNMLVGNIPMSAEEHAIKLARLAVLEHPKFQTWFQG